MNNKLRLGLRYLSYWFNSKNGRGHGTHSPFVFDFIRNVLRDNIQYEDFNQIEKIRQQLLKDERLITIDDHGAGSSQLKSRQRRISDIAATSVKPRKYAQLLYRIAKHYHPSDILELGTSLGITTSYFSNAIPRGKVLTIEGSPEIAKIASEVFKSQGLQNIDQYTGNFDELLPAILKQHQRIDLCFIDGNHRYQPTLNYFEQLLLFAGNDTMLIFDDVYWSGEMEKAWQKIKEHKDVRATIDLFFMGIVLFRKEFIEKQHFVVRF